MSYARRADPLDDFRAYDAHISAELDKLPRCSYCDNPIQDDFCYEINDELVCKKCLNEHHRVDVENYIERYMV